MKRKSLYVLSALLLFMADGVTQAQSTVTITRNSGAVYSYTVQSDGSITFDGNYVNIKESATSDAVPFNMADISKMTFSESAGIADIHSAVQPLLYPNPAQSYCVVRGADNGLQHVTVYSMTGAKLIDTTVENEGRIEISNLPSGVYMVKVNDKTTKLVKW